MLLFLKVYALRIFSLLRKNLVEELIEIDIFKINQPNNLEFIIEILNSFISIIVSILRRIEYITKGESNEMAVNKIIKILKEHDNGNATQKFSLALFKNVVLKVVPS